MVKFYDSLSPDLSDWCMSQPLFYIASAPRYGDHVNISPKGLPSTTFSILSPNKAAYIDATGSGAETIAHLESLPDSFRMLDRAYELGCTFWHTADIYGDS
ncbi:hypothetical protein KCU91_g686, partial [Aureobasidium melanogenum]